MPSNGFLYTGIFIILAVTVHVVTSAKVCPSRCSCSNSSDLPFIFRPWFSPVYQVQCNFTEDVSFNFTEELNAVVSAFNDSTQLDIQLYCRSNSAISWTDSSFLRNSFSLRMFNCNIISDGVVFPERTGLKIVLFKQMPSESIEKINFRGLQSTIAFSIVNCSLTKIPDLPSMPSSITMSFQFNDLDSLSCDFLLSQTCISCIIDFSDNQIKSLPRCPNLSASSYQAAPKILIARNRLEDVSALETLQFNEVDLSVNNITELTNLRYQYLGKLNVSHNGLRIIKNTFFPRSFMMTLDLSFNQIQLIERGSFSALFNLKELFLTGNQLVQFNQILTPGLSVTSAYIYLNRNRLIHPPYDRYDFQVNPQLRIKSSENDFTCDCKMGLFQRTVTLGAGFVDMDKIKCYQPERLRGQYISNINLTVSCPMLESCPQSCECDYNVSSAVTIVLCQNRNFTSLPLEMPTGNLAVHLSDNSIEEVTERDYFGRIVKLDLSSNNIREISSTGLGLLSSIRELLLQDNKLKYLPQSVEDVNFTQNTSIYLSQNPWQCNCDTIWFPQWLKDGNTTVKDANNLVCSEFSDTEKRVIDVKSSELHCEPVAAFTYTAVAISLGIVIVIIIVTTAVLVRYRFNLKVLMYTRLHFDLFGPESLENHQYKENDVFIVYNDDDFGWTKDVLLHRLENGEPVFKTLIPDRDFLPGTLEVDNITAAIDNSHCAVFVFSHSFKDSEKCLSMFHQAYARMLEQKDLRIIIIMKEKLNAEELNEDLQAYIKSHTYIEVGDRLFWDKLLYVLPKPSYVDV